MSNSTSITHFYFFTFVILLLTFINQGSISAFTIHRGKALQSTNQRTDPSFNIDGLADVGNDDQDDDVMGSLNVYPRKHSSSNYIAAIPSFELRHGVVHLIPYKKRTIPLELQKALYAHGIVGR